MLANAVLWGTPSGDLLDAIDLDAIDDEWCRSVVAAVVVLRDEGRPVTLPAVHEMLVDVGAHGEADAWRLVLADAGAEVGDDAVAVYAERVKAEHRRNLGRRAVVRAADRLETTTDPTVVLAELARELAELAEGVSA